MRRLYVAAAAVSLVGLLASTTPARATFVLSTTEPANGQKVYIDKANKNVAQFVGFIGANKSSQPHLKIQTVGSVDTGSGYASITPTGNTILTQLIFSPEDPALKIEDILFEFQANDAGTGYSSKPGKAVISLIVNGGGTGKEFTFTNFKANADQGPIGIIASDGDSIQSLVVSITDAGGKHPGFKAVKHIVDGYTTVVPLPAALPLFLGGLAGLGLIARRCKVT